MGISLEHVHSRSKGDVGENVCCRFLVRNGFQVITRNYRKKWGELDIVAFKDGEVHVFEVKSVTFSPNARFRDAHVPEENVHASKLARIRRTVRTFLAETGKGEEAAFSFHVLCVFLDLERAKVRIKWIRNVIL